jgi:SAM-dependent methyltransferase
MNAGNELDPTIRFSTRVREYIKYRPGYPPAVWDLLRRDAGLTPSTAVADIGSGTGISAEPLLKQGNIVYCVEPNGEMRAAGEDLLGHYVGFRSVAGTGERTTLPPRVVDMVVCAQAFHWFDHATAAAEFKRITRPQGFVVVMWNDRSRKASRFLRGYDELLVRYGIDYLKVAHEHSPMTVEKFEDLFNVPFRLASFANEQQFDLKGLRGRVASASYAPRPGQPGFVQLFDGLGALFKENAQDGRVRFEYQTNVFYGQLF